MYRAVILRLYPNQEQAELFSKNTGCRRFIYNQMLALRIEHYEMFGQSIHKNGLMKLLPDFKIYYPWLKEVDSTTLQQTIHDLDKAYQGFFNHASGFPNFKKKGRRDSFRCVMNIFADENYLKIGKHGWIKYRGGWEKNDEGKKVRILEGKEIHSITVSLDVDQWYASCLIEVPDPTDEYKAKYNICGIDLGVSKPLTVAYENLDGELVTKVTGLQYSIDLEKKEIKRKRYQRSMARKVKNSANRAKAKLKVARAYQNERNFRKDWVEKTSFKLATLFEHVSFEDLNIRQMTRHGGNYKRQLNHGMRRLGLALLVARTEQKVLERRGSVLYVDPAYTSQACSDCGSINKLSRKSQARFKCVDCGFTANADRNASINVLRRGQDYLSNEHIP